MSTAVVPARPGTALRLGPVSGVLRWRHVAVPVVAFGVLVLVSAVSMGRGDFPISVPDVLRALVGLGEGPQEFIVRELRAPRVVVGADLITRTVLPQVLPVGILTALIGAPYLLWLLVRGRRRSTS